MLIHNQYLNRSLRKRRVNQSNHHMTSLRAEEGHLFALRIHSKENLPVVVLMAHHHLGRRLLCRSVSQTRIQREQIKQRAQKNTIDCLLVCIAKRICSRFSGVILLPFAMALMAPIWGGATICVPKEGVICYTQHVNNAYMWVAGRRVPACASFPWACPASAICEHIVAQSVSTCSAYLWHHGWVTKHVWRHHRPCLLL